MQQIELAVMNWSSGKDAALAFHLLRQHTSIRVDSLLTTINADYDRVFMHGIREELLEMQAGRMGLPLIKVKLPPSPTDDLYRQSMTEQLTLLKGRGVTAAVYGDIFLDDLRTYREQQLSSIGMNAVFPLWKMSTTDLVAMVDDAGIEAVIVCVSARCLGKEFLGRRINRELLNDLPARVDPCGENGEYHSFVYNAPFFSSPIPISLGEIVYKSYDTQEGVESQWDTGFYFQDVALAR